MKYKEYQRLYPKMRLSYSLYKYWVRQNWMGVWDYFTGLLEYQGLGAKEGKEVHKWLELHGMPKKVREIVGPGRAKKERKIEVDFGEYIAVGVLDVSLPDWIIDYKTGSMNGFHQQLEMYGWLRQLVDGKRPTHGMLVSVKPVYDKEKIKSVEVHKTSVYGLDDRCSEWEDKLYEMHSSISAEINNGKLDKFLQALK